MTTTPVIFWGRNAAPPFNGPLTVSETTPGDVNTASFFDASNNPVNQGIVLGEYVKFGFVEIGESLSNWRIKFHAAGPRWKRQRVGVFCVRLFA